MTWRGGKGARATVPDQIKWPSWDIRIWPYEARTGWRCVDGFSRSCSGSRSLQTCPCTMWWHPCSWYVLCVACSPDWFCSQHFLGWRAQWTIHAVSWIILYCNVVCSSPQHQQCTTASFPCRAGDFYHSLWNSPVALGWVLQQILSGPHEWQGCAAMRMWGYLGNGRPHSAFQIPAWQSQRLPGAVSKDW